VSGGGKKRLLWVTTAAVPRDGPGGCCGLTGAGERAFHVVVVFSSHPAPLFAVVEFEADDPVWGVTSVQVRRCKPSVKQTAFAALVS
jgi:hypothetical protein